MVTFCIEKYWYCSRENAITRNMNKRIVAGIAIALVMIGGAGWKLGWFASKPTTTVLSAEPQNNDNVKKDPWATTAKDRESQKPQAAQWNRFDPDPVGPLRLEGQVLGPDGQGVAGAEVVLSSVPVKKTKSQPDGSFAFDALVGRKYSVQATAGELYAGPVLYKLSSDAPPLILNLSQGSKVEVTVIDDKGQGISNATVAISDGPQQHTNAEGKVTMVGVAPGWTSVKASMEGYAAANRLVEVGVQSSSQATLTLRRGVRVTGKVVDEAGKPIANASVLPRSKGRGAWMGEDEEDAVKSDDTGAFAFPAVAAGNYTFTAKDNQHAPGESIATKVGSVPVADVQIMMKAGASVSGVVQGSDGKPSPFATVRLAKAEDEGRFGGALRQTIADDKGKFVVAGLPRDKMQLRAESEDAASKLVAVDLEAALTKTNVVLTLDVTGQIAGVVVDETGQPIAEATVNATVDFTSSTDFSAASLSGFSTASTDGAGAFTIKGLPTGDYKVWAQRPTGGNQEWGQNGAKAKTGDKAVRVVLAAAGGIKGKLIIEGISKAPKIAMVSEGWNPATNAVDGNFELKNINPGKKSISIRGPEFSPFSKYDIEVAPGKTVDIGTITLARGRTISGRVADSEGKPVVDAKVRLAWMQISSNDQDADLNDEMTEQGGGRVATTDAAGEFEIKGVSAQKTKAVATHPSRGASLVVEVPAGTDDIPNVALRLKGFGSIAGTVALNGKPLADTGVSIAAKGGAAIMSQTNSAGEFVVERVPEGPQVVTVMRSKAMSMKASHTDVVVVANQRAQKTINIETGALSAEIELKPLPKASFESALVFLLQGVAAPKNSGDIMDNFLQGGNSGPGGDMVPWLSKKLPPPVFTDLQAGGYTVCTAPLAGEMSDQSFGAKLGDHIQDLKVYCKQITIAASPAKQTFVHEVPSMEPFDDKTPPGPAPGK
jgi:uncharacterized GH25 family protein